MITVLGIRIIDRIKEAGFTQAVLSRHASIITTRLGFHEVTDEICSREAYIILHLKNQEPEKGKLVSELKELGGIETREMVFDRENTFLSVKKDEVNIAILGLLIERDSGVISAVQKILTQYGCNIRTRLGLNVNFYGEQAGLIILELKGDIYQRMLLEQKLQALNNVYVRTMAF